ncbi:MAG: LysR family transcriptional regulator [Polyangiaceae bacterium]|nr:LysR family transcriptional regulator [Polyangiaceae bacterium]
MQRSSARLRHALDWDDVRVFLALVQTKSLAGGARSLGMDRSTASRRVQSLERALGTRLFVRTHEGLRLSATGDRLRAHAERMASELRSLEAAAVAGGEEVSGLVRIATTEGMASRLIEGGLLDLRSTYPDLELEVLGSNRPVDLARGEADLAVRITPTKEAGLKVRVVAKLGISLFASPGYLRERGRPRSVAQLAGHDALIPSGDLATLAEGVWLASRPGIRIAFRSSSMPALVLAAVRNHGLCAITRAWGDATPGLEHVMPIEHIAPRPVWLVVHPDVAKRAAVRLVADRIADAFRAIARA